jgi:5'-3' exonuclease
VSTLTQDGPAIRLFLVDGSAYLFRAYHALPPLTRKSDGLPVGAVQGFCNMLWKLLRDMQGDTPTHLAVIWDHSEKTFRNKLYDKYKAHRPPPPEDLIPQFPLVREATLAFGVPAIELPGYEADDLIAAYACEVRELGGETVIVSSDKDLMQLVGDGVSMFDPMKGLRIDREQVFEKFGVYPDKVVDVQALCGDSVDNVPGAPGIGIKTAAQLINEYGDLDTLLQRAGEIKQPKRRETLIEFADQIRLSRALVQLDCDTPLPEPIDDLIGARARQGRAGRLPGADGVPLPGPPGRRRQRLGLAAHDGPSAGRRAQRAGGVGVLHRRGRPRRRGSGRAGDDRSRVLCPHPGSGDPAGLGRQGHGQGPGRLRHRDRRPVVGQCRPVRRVAGRSPPARPATSRSAIARRTAWPWRPPPTWCRSRSTR